MRMQSRYCRAGYQTDEIKDIEENDTAKRQAIQRPVFCGL